MEQYQRFDDQQEPSDGEKDAILPMITIRLNHHPTILSSLHLALQAHGHFNEENQSIRTLPL